MVYVIGQGLTKFCPQFDRSIVNLGREAAAAALTDAGISPAQVETGYFANVFGGALFGDIAIGQDVFAAIGIHSIPVVNVDNACTSGSTAIHLAFSAIEAGQCDLALVVGAEKMCVPAMGLVGSEQTDLDSLLGMAAPVGFAMRAHRHMLEFGTSPAQLAAVTVKSRKHGGLNPYAQFGEPVTLEDVLADQMIADPLTRSQCCPVADGAAAVVLASDRIAASSKRAVRINTSLLASGSYPAVPDFAHWETDYRCARRAYEQAGIGPEELDVVECHDAFTIGEILHYEALGLCPEGEGGAFAESGATTLGGSIPVNPSGGLLSRGHPPAATGIAQICELVTQLRHEAGRRQVEDCKTALAHCMGGDKRGDTKSCTIAILTR